MALTAPGTAPTIRQMKTPILSLLVFPALLPMAVAAQVQVIVQGEVRPGVYGRVEIGPALPPPPLVYERPVTVVTVPAPPPPVYLHVPPGHAKNWKKHCKKYDACNRPVYFVKSAEYEPKKKKKKES